MKQIELGTFETTLHGLPFLCSDDAAVGRVIKKNEYELSEIYTITQAIKPGDVFVDAGANVGIFTTLAAKLVGSTGRVFSFEPDPFNQKILRTNVEKNGFWKWVHIHNAAAGAKQGRKFLYQSINNTGDHRTWNDGKEERPTASVEVQSIDDVMESFNRIDVLKVDVQGDEMNVLRGAEQVIDRSLGMFLSIEYWPYGLTQNGSSPVEFADWLFSRFVCYVMYPQQAGMMQSCTKEALLNVFGHNDDQVLNLWCVRRR
jgi:FkbM family methyltransferase